ncbi:MAG: serine/threonine protein kinase, partial [Chitinophagaceae bacterium]|nr:serine/threonine protein kinase [Anaerolineae bacterium]
MTNIGDIIGDRYRIEAPLGQGGMATVYRGLDTLNGLPIAVKLLKPEVIQADPEIVARFDREGEALRRLNHPSIVKVLATVVEDDNHYVVLEYVGGGDLRELIEDQRRKSEMLPIARVLEIALDLSDALTRAHRLKIIHRDIKPANVLLAEDGTPRLTDFGVAHFSDGTRVTQTGEMIGTLAYISPETILGDKPDARADIWSFGVMCYELLTLRRPFDEYSTGALLNAIVSKPPDSLQNLRPDAPLALSTLIEQMLVKDPQKRINSARLIGAQLEAIIGGKEIPATLDDNTPTPSKLPAVRDDNVMDDSKTVTPATGGYPPPPSVDTGERIPDSMYPEDSSPLPKSATSTRASSPTVEIPASQAARIPPLVWVGLAGLGLVIAAIAIFALMSSGNYQDSDTSDSQSAGIFQVEPVAAGEFMVLVADFEATNGTSRD